MQYIKGKTSRKLMMEYQHIQKAFWGRHIWGRGYFVASSGNVTDEVIQSTSGCNKRASRGAEGTVSGSRNADIGFQPVSAGINVFKPSPSGEGG